MNQAPKIDELAATIVAQIEANISQTIPWLPKGFTHVLAAVLAGAVIVVYKYAGWLGLQTYIEFASWNEVTINGRTFRPLVELGKEMGVGVPLPATQAELTLTVPVLTIGAVIPKGTAWSHEETGLTFTSNAQVTLAGATYPIPVTAAGDAQGGAGLGTIGNLAPGEKLNSIKPVAGMGRESIVASIDQAAVDSETEGSYRGRLRKRRRRPPQGGAFADYQTWAESVPGVLNAYPYKGTPPGSIIVYIEANAAAQTDNDGTPSAGLLDDVTQAIKFDENGEAKRCPPQVFDGGLDVVSITRLAYEITLIGLTPDTEETVLAINQAVDEYLRSLEHFQVGLAQLPRLDQITHGAVAGVAHSVAQSRGATLTNIELTKSAIPVLNNTLAQGEKAKLVY